MQLSKLEDSGLGLSQSQLLNAMEPFVHGSFDGNDDEWNREITRRRKLLIKRAWRPLLFGTRRQYGGRDSAAIHGEYDSKWAGRTLENYDTTKGHLQKAVPWIWHEHRFFASALGGARMRLTLLSQAIALTKPKRVLEIGCGTGMNLFVLASQYPETEFSGVELTEGGCAFAKNFQEFETLPDAIQGFAPGGPESIRDKTAFRRVQIRQGDASNLPFEDGAFDFVCTVLALEQMESLRHKALSELARVTSDAACMIEPFYESNSGFWSRAYISWRDYFRGKIEELPRYGLAPEIVTEDMPQKHFEKAAMVLARKR